MQQLGLGIDTGGTFTDAAIVEMGVNRVLASAKAPTTRYDLAVGIAEAVGRLPASLLGRIGLVSLSTTLATNSIVEGNGAPTCLVLIGYDRQLFRSYDLQRLLPTANLEFVRGGHTTVGAEAAPLEVEALHRIAAEQAGQVSAFAVSGFFGVRNPEHELRAREILERETGLPVTCGHELASELDSVLRAATCALNASLVPLLRDLMESLRRALSSLGVQAPIMVVRGDGSLMRVEMAMERPVETILSGPAASVVGAQAIAGERDMLVVDVGGTTTDLATVRDGLPLLNRQGATVGRWRTLVRAVETSSSGLGGDSQVTVNGSEGVRVGPRRAVPLAFIAQQFPKVKADLRLALSRRDRMEPGDGVFFLPVRSLNGQRPSDVEERILGLLSAGPQPLWRLAERDPWAHFYLSKPNLLENSGIISRAGFTPTDALHVTGAFEAWDGEASRLGAEFLGYWLDQNVDELVESVLQEVQRSLVRTMVRALTGAPEDGPEGMNARLLDLALTGERNHDNLEVRLHSRLPIVGLGAPAGHFVAPAGRVLGATALLPEHHAVANAVGAICGSVVVREVVQVQAVYRASGLDGYVLTGPFAAETFPSRDEAVREGERRAELLAREGAVSAGAADVEVRVVVEEQEGTAGPGFGDRMYLGSTIVATAVGRPRFAEDRGRLLEEDRLW